MTLLRRAAVLLLGFRGEIGRRAFVLGVVGAFVVAMGTGVLLVFAVRAMLRFGLIGSAAVTVGAIVSMASVVMMMCPLVWSMLALTVKRHRALKLPGWTGAATFVVLLGAVVVAAKIDESTAGRSADWLSLLFLAWLAALCLWPSLTSARQRAVEAF